jgi:hypothetical protein
MLWIFTICILLYVMKYCFVLLMCRWLIKHSSRWRMHCTKQKPKPMIFVHKWTILIEWLPIVGEVSANFCGYRVLHGQRNRSPRPLILGFWNRSRDFSIQVVPQLYSRGWVDPVPDTLLRKCGSAENRTWDLWICSQELWPLDHRGGPMLVASIVPVGGSVNSSIFIISCHYFHEKLGI